MSEDVASRLRELARDHSEARLTLTAYRRLRAPLLDSLSTRGSEADGPEVITQPRATVTRLTNVDQTSSAQRETLPPAPQPGPEVRPGSSRLRRAVLVATLLLFGAALGIGVWLAWGKRLGNAGGGAPMSVQGSIRETESDPLRTDIQALLDSDDWGPERLVKVNTALIEAGSERLHTAAGTEWFQRFTDAVRQRMKEQQALGVALTPDNSPLAALAVTIGIDVTSQAAAANTPAGGQLPAPRPVVTAESQHPEPAPPGPANAPTKAPEPAAAQGTATAGTSPPTAATGPVTPPTSQTTTSSAGNSSTPVAANAPPSGTTAPAQTTACRGHYCQDPLSSGEQGIRLAIIPAGTYQMGNPDVPTERPAHQVTLRQSFAISVEEVSQAEFRWYCEKTRKPCPAQPSWTGDDYPVVNVSWSDATEYARWLSQMTGKHYRLPTEAEWEYAARAGQNGLFPQGDSLNLVDAYFSDKSKLTAPAPRRQNKDFNPNRWHLYHMVGNVREWVQDSWEASFEGAPTDGSAREKIGAVQKVVRGGSYADARPKLRLTTREGVSADARDAVTGIRVVREIP